MGINIYKKKEKGVIIIHNNDTSVGEKAFFGFKQKPHFTIQTHSLYSKGNSFYVCLLFL